MKFKFDKARYKVVDSKISLGLCFLVLISGVLDLLFGMKFLLLGFVTIPSVAYWSHKGFMSETYYASKEAEVVEITESKVKVLNELTGYEVSRELAQIKNAQYKALFGFGVVIIQFTTSETFKFLCYKNPEQLLDLLSKNGS